MTEHFKQDLADIEGWLSRLDQALQPLPEGERDDILGNGVYAVLVLLVVIDAALARFSLVMAVKGVKGREVIAS